MHGNVQGVGFRMAARREAARLGVVGNVRNRFDGTVEAEVEGEADAVHAMVSWLEQGPSSARVDRVDVAPVEPRGDAEFRVS
ncbi:acylphosphatase [Agrococcus beijingensis]|uniref:acylphosphatase n=1 Tax=Agrococcus beijingensis TaxID=3068634 RepID=UPI0027422943|nr:acylphosphatase [Agrococcus sp. REN33]